MRTKDEIHANHNINNSKHPQIYKKKKRKKCKKGLRIFLCIFAVFLLIFVIRMNENGWTKGGFLATILGHNSKTAEKLEPIYIIITGESQNLTDSIMICSYNPKENTAAILSVPRDTFVGKNENKATANDKINTLYNKGSDRLISEINEMTGLDIKYYMNIDTKGLRDLIDAIGGVYFDVPIDMDYDDPYQDLHIHLKAGYQLLDGDKSEQLLRFRHNADGTSYPASYGDNDIGRMRTQREFITTLAKQITQKDLFKNIKKYVQIAKDNVTTNFDFSNAIHYVPYIIDFNMDNLNSRALPGEPKKCNGVWLYICDKDETKNVVKELF